MFKLYTPLTEGLIQLKIRNFTPKSTYRLTIKWNFKDLMSSAILLTGGLGQEQMR